MRGSNSEFILPLDYFPAARQGERYVCTRCGHETPFTTEVEYSGICRRCGGLFQRKDETEENGEVPHAIA
jgi:transcription initiation factor IIE alpha subunit